MAHILECDALEDDEAIEWLESHENDIHIMHDLWKGIDCCDVGYPNWSRYLHMLKDVLVVLVVCEVFVVDVNVWMG